MHKDLENIILRTLQAQEILDVQLIQNLWSGYGELSRVTTDRGSVILKLIMFPSERDHPRGWTSDIGHERKKKSYRVEQHWYTTQPMVSGARMAKALATGNSHGKEYILLEDLTASGFDIRNDIGWNEINSCLSWLANFHRYYIGHRDEHLWHIGTYWHLDTRPEELAALSDQQLQQAAPLIDKKLNDANYQTIVHGDAKLANFLFDESEAAAVDFQYVGAGVGIKDVAYFLSSIFSEDELAQFEHECLDTYFRHLNLPDVEQEWRTLFPIAWCDFYRFLQGWSPGHWKINAYSKAMKERALACL